MNHNLDVNETQNCKIIFFDGVCGLCDRFVTFMIDHDKNNIFKFSAQQSELFQIQKVNGLITSEMGDSIFYLRDAQIFSKSTAVLLALADFGGFWKLVLIFKFVPLNIRDSVYDLIAKNRYRIFGKRESCRMPTSDEKSKFI